MNIEAPELIEMYKAGFLDGSGKKWDSKAKKACFKAFNIRFIKKLSQKVKTIRKKERKGPSPHVPYPRQ